MSIIIKNGERSITFHLNWAVILMAVSWVYNAV